MDNKNLNILEHCVYLATMNNTVNLVIFACLNFLDFFILGLLRSLKFLNFHFFTKRYYNNNFREILEFANFSKIKTSRILPDPNTWHSRWRAEPDEPPRLVWENDTGTIYMCGDFNANYKPQILGINPSTTGVAYIRVYIFY